MRVCVFYPWGEYVSYNPRGMKAVQAVEAGIRRHGHQVVTRQQNQGYAACDVAVMWGCSKKTMPETRCRDEIVEAHGDRPFVRLERGYLDRERYEAMGLGGLWGRADYRNANSPGDRFRRFGLQISPWHCRSNGHILVLGQVPWDTSVQHTNFERWAENTRAFLESRFPRQEVRFRPHPRIEKTVSLTEDLDGASCAVALTSTSAVEALLAGVPVLVTDPGSVCWRISGCSDLSRVEDPPTPERTQFFHDLAYAQWTHDEMATGETWAHLFPS